MHKKPTHGHPPPPAPAPPAPTPTIILPTSQILSTIKSQIVRQKVLALLDSVKQQKQSKVELELDLCYLGLRDCQDFGSVCLDVLKLHGNSIRTIDNLKVHSSLVYLSLGSNNLQSLQLFPTLLTPCLQTLNLYSNNISMLQPLRKCQWPELKQLNLQQNPIKDLEVIAMMHRNWGNGVVVEVWLEDRGKGDYRGVERVRAKCHQGRIRIVLNPQ